MPQRGAAKALLPAQADELAEAPGPGAALLNCQVGLEPPPGAVPLQVAEGQQAQLRPALDLHELGRPVLAQAEHALALRASPEPRRRPSRGLGGRLDERLELAQESPQLQLAEDPEDEEHQPHEQAWPPLALQ